MKDITPKREHGIIYRPQNTIFGYQGWPSVCRDENGTLYAVSSSFRCQHVCPFGKTSMWISRNGGKTWTPPIVINDTYLDDRDAGILYMGNGRMLVTWFCHPVEAYLGHYHEGILNAANPIEKGPIEGMFAAYPMIPKEHANGGSFLRVSEDYGVTWSETIQIPVSAPHGPSLCKDGTLIYLGKDLYSDKLPAPEIPKAVAAYASTDGGYTWTRRGLCEKPADLPWDCFHEPHVVELEDGTLFGAIRAQGQGIWHGFSIYTTVSKDGGRTWSEWKPTNIAGSPPHLLKHSSGALICVYGCREQPFGEFALVSRDNGETWTERYAIDDRAWDGDLGYPASVEMDDGSILTVYYQKQPGENGAPGDGKPSILFTRWSLA